MAHSSLRNHRKVKTLVRLLKSDRLMVIGALQHFWWAVDECKAVKPDGALPGWTEANICDSAEWPGDPNEFVSALFQAGFLDVGDGMYFVHDYWEWCPNFVMKRWFDMGIIKDQMKQTAFAASKCGLVATSYNKSQLVAPMVTPIVTPMVAPIVTYTTPNVTPRNVTKRNQTKPLLLPSAADAAPVVEEKVRSEKQKARDVLWEPLEKHFFPNGTSKRDQKRLGDAVTALQAKSVTPDQIPERISAYPKVMPGGGDCLLTLEALIKHWDVCVIAQKPIPDELGGFWARGGTPEEAFR
jgi:hypothetical protein